jgi:hypothetical protein
MTGELHCFSFHSVKGGVGKSTLSTLLACNLARSRPGTPVVLIDMDLTGTSLSDVLPLQAPRWAEDRVDLLTTPVGFHSYADTLSRVEARHGGPRDATDLQIPYLNDFLLWADPDWSTERDIHPSALSWKMQGAPDNLHVIPSSALPEDLRRIIPVIFDEEHAAYLEARIEALLDAIVPDVGVRIVVFDTPPTIPGLSRSILSLGFRLGGPIKRALADDGYIPPRLALSTLRWRIALVLSQDRQDLRAAERWMAHVDATEQDLVRLVINRVPPSEMDTLRGRLFGGDLGLSGPTAPKYHTLANFADVNLVPDNPRLQFFHQDDAGPPSDLGDLFKLADWDQ